MNDGERSIAAALALKNMEIDALDAENERLRLAIDALRDALLEIAGLDADCVSEERGWYDSDGLEAARSIAEEALK